MTDDEKLMQQAFDAFEDTHFRIIGAGLLDQDLLDRNFTVATALRERLAQPKQEPVLFIHPDTFAITQAHVGAWKPGHELPGYTSPSTPPRSRASGRG